MLAVDGRNSSGKTSLARRLREEVAGAAVVRADDVAWWHSRFGWAGLLTDGVLLPARAGQPVSYRIIEGVGAARREHAHLLDAAVWVQSDQREAERRSQAGRRPCSTTATGWPRKTRS